MSLLILQVYGPNEPHNIAFDGNNFTIYINPSH